MNAQSPEFDAPGTYRIKIRGDLDGSGSDQRWTMVEEIWLSERVRSDGFNRPKGD